MPSRPRRIFDRLAHLTPAQWLIVAAVFHLLITLAVFFIGHFRWLPSSFDEHGIGLSFAIDGTVYRGLISDLADALKHRGVSAWLGVQVPFHCRLFSLTFVFLESIVGSNILAAEPLNLIYYLAILTFVYLLTKELFDSCVGLMVAGVVAIWPTLILHTTQLLRDSLSIALMLALLWILTIILQRQLSWRKTVVGSIASIALVIVFWLTRGNVWNIVFATLAVSTVLLTIRMVREKKLLAPNFILLTIIFGAVLIVPTRIESTTIAGNQAPTAIIAIPSRSSTSKRSMWSRLVTQISARRSGFRDYSGRASNLDSDVQFNNAQDIFRYLPRAAAIGLFAPFPMMWFESGSSGRSGRLLAGAETVVMYLLYLPAVVCVWSERRKLAVWLMFFVTTIGLIALGLVVANVGALYRLRYVFWILVIVLAMRGVKVLRTSRSL